MASTASTAEPKPGPEGSPIGKPYDLNTEIPAAAEPDAPNGPSEFVMGPRQVASLAFVAILVLGIISAFAYFAGRKNTEAPKVTERVVERVIQVPTPKAAETPPPPEAAKSAAFTPAPTTPRPVKEQAFVQAPIFNRTYLQAGSVEVGVAEVIVEGLRNRGVPATVGIGINNKVARILIGPFNTMEEQKAAQKKVEDMGFHPYPRSFTEKDLEQPPANPAPPKP